jgi:hypothetical protein
MTNESIDPEDVVSYDATPNPDQDGVASLHDAEAEQGDEEYLADEFELDASEARDLNVDLDRVGGETPRLD